MDQNVLHQFTSHIDGRNAQVKIYVDRIEWVRPRSISKGKMLTGVATMGLSLAATGTKGSKSGGTEMIPVKSISSVTTGRDGLLNSKVSVIVSGNTVDFRISHSETEIVKSVLTQLILGTHPSQQTSPPPAAPTYAAPPAPVAQVYAPPASVPGLTIPERLAQLSYLHQQGILTQQEHDAKRTAILAEL